MPCLIWLRSLEKLANRSQVGVLEAVAMRPFTSQEPIHMRIVFREERPDADTPKAIQESETRAIALKASAFSNGGIEYTIKSRSGANAILTQPSNA